MRIGIDARFYGSIGKGLGRYTQKLIENLEKISAQGGPASGGDHQYFIFLRAENFDEYEPRNPNFKKVLADYRWYTFAEQISFPLLLNKYKLDLVHFPHFNVPLLYQKKFAVTIHDLILVHFPTLRGTTLNPFFYWIKFLAYKIIIGSAIRRAREIVAVSNFTKNDILDHYKVKPEKISVTYESCDDFCNIPAQSAREIMEKYGIIEPYLLYVGNSYPHKNLEKLIAAFSEINVARKNLHLVLVGKNDYFYERLKKIVRENKVGNIIFAGYVPDSELDVIYQKAALYVFPSLYEGFGLPPLEAMAKGVPVISSDHPCMKEILGESAFYFDAQSAKQMAERIIYLLDNDELRKSLAEKGYGRIKKYSWKKMVEDTLGIYNKISTK